MNLNFASFYISDNFGWRYRLPLTHRFRVRSTGSAAISWRFVLEEARGFVKKRVPVRGTEPKSRGGTSILPTQESAILFNEIVSTPVF